MPAPSLPLRLFRLQVDPVDGKEKWFCVTEGRWFTDALDAAYLVDQFPDRPNSPKIIGPWWQVPPDPTGGAVTPETDPFPWPQWDLAHRQLVDATIRHMPGGGDAGVKLYAAHTMNCERATAADPTGRTIVASLSPWDFYWDVISYDGDPAVPSAVRDVTAASGIVYECGITRTVAELLPGVAVAAASIGWTPEALRDRYLAYLNERAVKGAGMGSLRALEHWIRTVG